VVAARRWTPVFSERKGIKVGESEGNVFTATRQQQRLVISTADSSDPRDAD